MRTVLLAARVVALAFAISALAIPLIPSADARAGEVFLRLSACARGGADCVSLTFDDGPDPIHTQEVIDTLRANGVPARFFVTGNRLDALDPSLRMYEGFVLGSHSYSHRRMRDATTREQHVDLLRGATVLERQAGERSLLYRPPRGQVRLSTLVLMRLAGYRPLGWSVSYDRFAHIEDQRERIAAFVDTIRPGDVILMHDGNGNALVTSEDLPGIISALKDRGYSFAEAR